MGHQDELDLRCGRKKLSRAASYKPLLRYRHQAQSSCVRRRYSRGHKPGLRLNACSIYDELRVIVYHLATGLLFYLRLLFYVYDMCEKWVISLTGDRRMSLFFDSHISPLSRQYRDTKE